MSTIASQVTPARRLNPNLLNGTAYLLAVFAGLVSVFVSRDLWLIPLLAMTVYLAAGYAPALRSGFIFEFADSFYYLGFTLSVGSLLASLDPFHTKGVPDPTKVFHYFGLGLFTTF